jgi:hypothetical protein
MTRQTISEEYLRLQTELHRNPHYGVASLGFASLVADLIRLMNLRSVSDYGAGKKRLLEGLEKAGIKLDAYLPYDPAFPDYGPPREADLVCCIDVLEHIEPERLDAVLEELAAITVKAGFFSIHTGPAAKTLPDGRNAHLIQRPSSWWLLRLCRYFDVLQLAPHQAGSGFWLVVKRAQSDQA